MLKTIFYFMGISLLLLSPFVGSVDLHLSDILNNTHLANKIFLDIRLPRVVFAFSAGVILALGGLVYQSIFRNALMTPYTLGISSGAVLGAGIALKLGLVGVFFGLSVMSFFGFSGALLTLFLLLYMARFLKNSHQESLLLLGIALSLFYTSALTIVFYLGSAVQNDILLRFTMGSLSTIGWQEPLATLITAVLLLLGIYFYRFELQLLNISQEGAKLRGVDTQKTTFILLLLSSLAVGLLVSLSGPIGFIGLIVPHIVTKLFPATLNRRILKTALFGGFFLVLCDTFSRAINTSSELPIGIVTALIGGPFFIYLIISRSKY